MTRVYPICCTSAFCGRLECEGCRNKPILDEFKTWMNRVGATKPDPVWSPLVYVASTGTEDVTDD